MSGGPGPKEARRPWATEVSAQGCRPPCPPTLSASLHGPPQHAKRAVIKKPMLGDDTRWYREYGLMYGPLPKWI